MSDTLIPTAEASEATDAEATQAEESNAPVEPTEEQAKTEDVASNEATGEQQEPKAEEPESAADKAPEKSTEKPSVEKPKAKKSSKPPTTAQAIDALVTTVTSMTETVQTLSKTVDSLSDKVVTPPTVEAVPEQAEEKDDSLAAVAISCLGTLASYVGIGLIAAAAMRSAFDGVTMLMAVTGVVLFLANGLFVDRGNNVSGINAYLATAGMLTLGATGVGLLVGGIQRFGDEPHRSAVFVPLGAALFLVASAWKVRDRLRTEHLVWMAGVGVWVCLFLGLGLGVAANNIDPKPKSQPKPPAAESHAEATTTVAPAAEHGATDTHGATDDHSAADSHGESHEVTTTVAPAADAHGEKAEIPPVHIPESLTKGSNPHSIASGGPTVATPDVKSGDSAVQEAVDAANKAAAGH